MKKIYLTPQTDVLDLSYAEPVCAASVNTLPDFDYQPLNPGDMFSIPGGTSLSDMTTLPGNMFSL